MNNRRVRLAGGIVFLGLPMLICGVITILLAWLMTPFAAVQTLTRRKLDALNRSIKYRT